MHISVICATLLILILHLCAATRIPTETLEVGNGAQWGDWTDSEFCPDDHFAVGYIMKIEDKQGRWTDDTSLNGIRLLCSPQSGGNSNSFGDYISSGVSPWGSWRGNREKCRTGYFLVGFVLQVEDNQGIHRDDTAANYIKFECRAKENYTDHYVLNHSMGRGYWGADGAWSNKCPHGTAICGIQTKIESPHGHKDDTALNDVKFYCCKF